MSDQRDIAAQNWGATQYQEIQDEIKQESSWALLSFGIFVFGALSLAGVLVYFLQ